MPHEPLKSLVGSWAGTCRTWFEPGTLADESVVKGTIRPILGGRFLRHEYESTIQGKPRHGDETIALNSVTKRYQVAWIDDFHMNYAILFSEGEDSANRRLPEPGSEPLLVASREPERDREEERCDGCEYYDDRRTAALGTAWHAGGPSHSGRRCAAGAWRYGGQGGTTQEGSLMVGT